VEVDLRAEGEEIVLTVQDDGPGIPEEELPQLFEPFYRIDRSRSKKTGGYGLGLSLCKRIVEAHGGRIEVTNRAARGVRVTVALPNISFL
jgi:signal transduction histidine kinase